ncbi:MAG: hypothetical protein AAB327_04825, partial [Actinomycetota bacterium]
MSTEKGASHVFGWGRNVDSLVSSWHQRYFGEPLLVLALPTLAAKCRTIRADRRVLWRCSGSTFHRDNKRRTGCRWQMSNVGYLPGQENISKIILKQGLVFMFFGHMGAVLGRQHYPPFLSS